MIHYKINFMDRDDKFLKSCDICFITLPGNWSSGQIPYYYLALSSYLESRDFKTEILDFAPQINKFYSPYGLKGLYQKRELNKNFYFNSITERLKILKPNFVGISIFTVDYFLAMELAASIKKTIDCKIVFGNVHASLFPDDCIYLGSPVDFVVTGEGEETLTELLKIYRAGGDLKNVAGLYFLDNGKPVRTQTRELLDISNLPPVIFHKIDMEYYLRPRQILIRNLVLSGVDIFTGRGCPYFCDFCAANSIYKAQGVIKRVRYQSMNNVFANIETLVKKYKIDGLYILDDTFTISEDRVLEFCERIRPLKIYWGADTRVNLITSKMLKAMKNSGCLQLDFGVETGSPEMLKKVSKGITVEQTINAFKICDEAGIRTLANILINLPGEEERHIKETKDLLKKIRPTVINVSILKPYPATPIFEENVKMGHLEYINALKKFLAGDLSIFKLCKHELDFKKISKKLAGYTNKDFRCILRDLKVTLRLILKSARRGAYLKKIFRIFVVELILVIKRIKARTAIFDQLNQ